MRKSLLGKFRKSKRNRGIDAVGGQVLRSRTMNEEREAVVRLLDGTFLGESLGRLSALYDEVEAQTGRFCERFGVHCTAGCGSCCEHFLPDITQLEARMVAAYLLVKDPSSPLIAKVRAASSDHCPLYDPDHPHHCTVYAARPLVCRLFAQCPSRLKDGGIVFRSCRFNGGLTMPAILRFPQDVPVKTMEAYGMELRSLDSGEVDDVQDLDVAVASALDEVSLVIAYLRDDDPDDDSTPAPMAS